MALMTLASLIVPIVDGLAKFLNSTLSPFCVAFGRYFTAAIIVLIIGARSLGTRNWIVTDFSTNALRTVLIVSTMTCFFFAINEIPLATAFGGYFLGPVIAAMLAALLLRERATLPRVAAVVLGLLGAYLIVRPGSDINTGSLLAVLSGVFFAGYLLTTRMAALTTQTADALRFQYVFGTLLLVPFAAVHWTWPTKEEVAILALMGAISVVCHFLAITAFRYAEAVVLSPLTYFELITAALIGLLVFAELPDAIAIMGISLIVGSGLALWLFDRPRLRDSKL